jgi:succinate-semialdehyde dehydrogenase/glutarate-semialdehyde dehydrogenase
MAAFEEEFFGPVGSVITVKDQAEAIALANQSPYGLGAAIFTQDIERGLRIAADEINAGTCVVNDLVRSDPRLPFGGIGESGFGRELGDEGIKEFVNIKTICLG